MEERVEFTMSDVIPEELLAGLSDTDREMESINRPSISYWRNCWIRLKKDKLAMLGIAIVVIMTLAAIYVPLFSPFTGWKCPSVAQQRPLVRDRQDGT